MLVHCKRGTQKHWCIYASDTDISLRFTPSSSEFVMCYPIVVVYILSVDDSGNILCLSAIIVLSTIFRNSIRYYNDHLVFVCHYNGSTSCERFCFIGRLCIEIIFIGFFLNLNFRYFYSSISPGIFVNVRFFPKIDGDDEERILKTE